MIARSLGQILVNQVNVGPVSPREVPLQVEDIDFFNHCPNPQFHREVNVKKTCGECGFEMTLFDCEDKGGYAGWGRENNGMAVEQPSRWVMIGNRPRVQFPSLPSPSDFGVLDGLGVCVGTGVFVGCDVCVRSRS